MNYIYDNIHNNLVRKAKVEVYQELWYLSLILVVILGLWLGFNNGHWINHAPVFMMP